MAVDFDLYGQVAIVTGASGGLGGAFARMLAARGAKVGLGARRVDRLSALAEEISAEGGRALPVRLDVTDKSSIDAAIETVQAELGVVQILVNNSGVVARKPIFEHDETDWDGVVDTNLKGAWLMSLEVSRRLVDHDLPGAIVNIASVLGYDRVSSQVHEYCASKAGLVQLTKSMATELARHDIRVNAIAPGYIVTEINREFLSGEAGDGLRKRIPQRSFGEAEDLEAILLTMVSKAGRYMTGSVVTVDGGLSVASV